MGGGLQMRNVSPKGLQSICNASDFNDMYAKLILASPTLHAIPNVKILDKTPAYIYKLTAVLDKVPGVPCVVSVKNDDHINHPQLLKAQRHRVFIFLKLKWVRSYLRMTWFVHTRARAPIQQVRASTARCEYFPQTAHYAIKFAQKRAGGSFL